MEKSRIDQALEAHKVRGYDCCESIFMTYSDLLGMDKKLAYAIADCYGSNTGINGVFDSYQNLLYFRYMYVCAGYGIDSMFGFCGALCGAQLCAAIRHNPIAGEVPRDMLAPFPLCDKIRELFVAETDAVACREFLDASRKTVVSYGCDRAIKLAAKLVEDLVFPGMFEPAEDTILPSWDIDAKEYWPSDDPSVYMCSAAPAPEDVEGAVLQYGITQVSDIKYANSTVEMTMGSDRLKTMRPPVSEILGEFKKSEETGEYAEGEYYYRGIFLEALRDEDDLRLLAGFWGLAKCCMLSDQEVRMMDMAGHGIQKMDDWGYTEPSAFACVLLNYGFARYMAGDAKDAMIYIQAAERILVGSDKALTGQRIFYYYYKALAEKALGNQDAADGAVEMAMELFKDVPGYEEQKEMVSKAV